MKSLRIMIIMVSCSVLYSQARDADIITLVFPFGARSCSMGEVGTALADDASALYWNVAGLGITDSRPTTLSLTTFYEPLLPAFGLRELWHSASALNFTLPDNWGSVSIFHNYINLGLNSFTDQLGKEIGKSWSNERVFSIGWGTGFEELGDSTNYLGVAFKYFNSKPGQTTLNSVAFDAGYIKKFKHGLRFGITLQNMGPNIRNGYDELKQPLPFTLNIAAGSKHEIPIQNLRLFKIAWEVRLDKELAVLHNDKDPDPFFKAFFTEWTDQPLNKELQQINYNSGIEIGILNTGYFRHGYLIDIAEEHYELHWGIGLSLFNHLNWDFGIIHSPEGYMKDFARNFDKNSEGASGARGSQWQISFSFFNLNSWSQEDWHWWRYTGR